jgi:Transposase, Mutator family
MTFPPQHRTKLHSTKRPNGEIKRRTEVVGIFTNEDAIVRLVGAILLEQNDEWTGQRARYRTLETIAPLSDDPTVSLPALENAMEQASVNQIYRLDQSPSAQAERLRKEARGTPPGVRRDQLLRRARQIEIASRVQEWRPK